jgi:hypothetical protein
MFGTVLRQAWVRLEREVNLLVQTTWIVNEDWSEELSIASSLLSLSYSCFLP